MNESVILVDELDRPTGSMEKMEAHRIGVLHRAFSVFIFNEQNEMLLQQRAAVKYHSPGLWTNACCSHPRPGEDTPTAAVRRLKEEMGFECKLTEIFDFIYKAEVGSGLIEHEFDHVFIGTFSGKPVINLQEVQDWKYFSLEEITKQLQINPLLFTVWFKIAFEQMVSKGIPGNLSQAL